MSNSFLLPTEIQKFAPFFLSETIEYTYVSDPNDEINPFGTPFYIAIKETGWIDDVFFVLDNEDPIKAKHVARGDSPPVSLFEVYHHFRVPSPKREAHWVYRIGYTMYITNSIFFEVRN